MSRFNFEKNRYIRSAVVAAFVDVVDERDVVRVIDVEGLLNVAVTVGERLDTFAEDLEIVGPLSVDVEALKNCTVDVLSEEAKTCGIDVLAAVKVEGAEFLLVVEPLKGVADVGIATVDTEDKLGNVLEFGG